ncbi:DUF2076 domain-containing protein [Buchnera aphidicola (Mindarus keteleerifoliae)]|uniref:DUF2076 domain-containing protein n=1 Tax=Buchnera aphidicola TaxID=9 RepID=UPI0031B679A7
MQKEEKILIENLFKKIEKVENQSKQQDLSADELIKNMIKKQPNAAYYLTQVVLVQELAIKKMNKEIQLLNSKIQDQKKKIKHHSDSFLFGCLDFLKNKKNDSNKKNNDYSLNAKNKEEKISSTEKQNSFQPTSGFNSNSFLSNAVQTAVGVASGIVMGNILTNLFRHDSIKEETVSDINSSESVLDPDISNTYIDNIEEEKNSNYYDINDNFNGNETNFSDENYSNDNNGLNKYEDEKYENSSYEEDNYEDDDNFI